MLFSCTLPPKAKYSLQWSKGIVLKAYREHTRAFDFLRKYYGVTGKILVALLASGRPEWHLLVKLAKYVETAFKSGDYRAKDPEPYKPKVAELYVCLVVDNEILNHYHANSWTALLTPAFFNPMLEEQENSKETGGWRPSQPPDLSDAHRKAGLWLHSGG